jgi:hypothetical protein
MGDERSPPAPTALGSPSSDKTGTRASSSGSRAFVGASRDFLFLLLLEDSTKESSMKLDRKSELRRARADPVDVEKRNTMPILANVLLEARKQGKEALDFAATISRWQSGRSRASRQAGRVTASAKSSTRSFASPEETVRSKRRVLLTIRCARAEFVGEPPPRISDAAEPACSRTWPRAAPVFAQMIERTMHLSPPTRPANLNGVYLELIPRPTRSGWWQPMVTVSPTSTARSGGDPRAQQGRIIPRKALGSSSGY